MGYFSLPILVSSQFWPCIKLALAINSPNQKIHRILFVSAADWAFQIHRLSLAKWLVEQGHKVAVICPPGEVTSELEKAGLKIFSMPLSRERISATEILASSKGIWKAVKEFEADILHCVSLRCILLGWIATRSQANPPRIVNHVIGMGSIFSEEPTSLKMHGFRKMMDWSLKRAFRKPGTITVFQNQDDKDWWSKQAKLRSEQVTCIAGSIDWKNDFHPEPGGPNRILYVGRMLRDKGIGELIDAWSQLQAAGSTVELYMCGAVDPGNPNSYTKSEVEALVQERGFNWLGRRDDIPQQMAAAHMVVLPTYREGFPKVILEAGMAKRAVVATDVAGCREIVEDQKTGLLVKSGEVKLLSEAMRKLLDDSSLRKCLAQNLYERVQSEFSDSIINPQWEDLYARIAK